MVLLKASIATLLALIITISISTVCADLLVQLNVNRPLNDVNEKFVSFTVDPADLYHALDGANRKTFTQMTTMLGSSYIKFSDDYNFIPDTDTKYRNPTKTIWKGFNRWTSAVNWTMIVPLPYQAGEWDPMESLRILNSSYTTGITDCIWQLGIELGPSVSEYFNDLNTLNLMVDTFTPYVDDWEVIGAEIPSGSTNEEIRRYIEYSKDMNAAFNWLQPADAMTSNAMVGSAYENDRVLRAMFNEKAPVWLNFMPKEQTSKSKRGSISKTTEDVTDVLRWAQTLGEAASSGFDAIFRRMDLDDLEHPSQSFFVTLTFKKVMGSRVFPARPFTIFLRSNKLYTHCANTVSGGIAFMIVNPDDETKQVSIRSATKLSGDEYWQYILTFKKNHAYLNNEKLTINSTLPPQIKTKSPNKSIQLNSPGKSVGFWVLPNAELEHCQFTEIDVDELERDSEEEKLLHKHISSSDKLLQQLIQETALPEDAEMKNNHRGRRYAALANRARHVVLKDKDEHMDSLAKLFEPLSLEEKTPKKREEVLEDRRSAALKWIKDLLDTAMQDGEDLFPLKRNTRSADDYFGALFGRKDAHKRSPIVKRITEIRKPEKKSIKPAYDPEHFNEEEYFKKMGTQNEPELPRVPEGDVHLTQITNVEGEDADASKERGKKKLATMKIQGTIAKETRHEMKPLRLLPTEFYEALPVHNLEHNQFKKPNKWNALLFPEPFTKKSIIAEKKLKSNTLAESTKLHDVDSDVEKVDTAQFQTGGQLAEDFLRAQEELARTFQHDHEEKEYDQKSNKKELSEMHTESDDELLEKIKSLRIKYIDYLAENLENYFNEHGAVGDLDIQKNMERTTATTTTELPWWNLSSLRKRRSARALRYPMPDEAWLTNMITKDEELLPLGSVMPERLADNERIRVSNHLQLDDEMGNKKYNGYLRTVKAKVDKVVDIVAKHVNDWYTTFTKPVEDIKNDVNGNRLKISKGKRRF
ncbi:uncharacterized protein LOC105209555 [Zeugodacus cucurbitae]|uniref:uncharacterized protein LOC105209555 n=1 Tax=Zeugodacus cucurbitae TaxID=28588 RepID=UPI0023D93B77|nr:uncharacterized protein LOC105209555 [Zeugodacus cucurbitae]